MAAEDWPHASEQRDPPLQQLPDTGPYGAPGNPGLFIASLLKLLFGLLVWLVRLVASVWRRVRAR